MPRPRIPIGSMLHGGHTLTTCPRCGREHAFLVTNTYRKTACRQRLRQCRFCGHAHNEVVPPPIVAGEDLEEAAEPALA